MASRSFIFSKVRKPGSSGGQRFGPLFVPTSCTTSPFHKLDGYQIIFEKNLRKEQSHQYAASYERACYWATKMQRQHNAPSGKAPDSYQRSFGRPYYAGQAKRIAARLACSRHALFGLHVSNFRCLGSSMHTIAVENFPTKWSMMTPLGLLNLQCSSFSNAQHFCSGRSQASLRERLFQVLYIP